MGAKRIVLATVMACVALATGASASAQCMNAADLTGDGTNDIDDFELFEQCNVMPAPECDLVELDVTGDGMVDDCDGMAVRCAYESPALGESCCTRVCNPRCNGDLNRDGRVNVGDLGDISTCFDQPTTPACDHTDLDADGDVDCRDFGAWACLFDTMTASADCCVDPPCRCNCSPFVTMDSDLNAEDITRVRACMGRDRSGECANADVNCDGEITECDADIVQAAIDGALIDMMLCGRVTCDDTPPPPPPPPPDASDPVVRFRGGGGGTCASAGGGPPAGFAFLIGVLLLVRTRGRARAPKPGAERRRR